MALVSEGKIIIDMDETVNANHATVVVDRQKCSSKRPCEALSYFHLGASGWLKLMF